MEESVVLAKREYNRRYYEKNKEKIKKNKREWQKNNPDKVKIYQERYWAKKCEELTSNEVQ